MKIVQISKLKVNKQNPRIIKDDNFNKLVNSVTDLKMMLKLRPIIIDEDFEVLGGNQRLAVCKHLNWTEVPTDVMTNDMIDEEIKGRLEKLSLDDEQDDNKLIELKLTREHIKNEFVIKDNASFGDWDYDALANNFDSEDLNAWAVPVWDAGDVDLEQYFEEDESEKVVSNKIVLEYTEDDYKIINEAFDKIDGSKEKIIWNLLGL